MTIVEPIPGNYGKSDWVDYSNNWREADAEWLQARGILRYASNATRDADLTTPGVGQVVYNQALDILQLRSSAGTWRNYAALPTNLTATQDNASGVVLAHVNAAGKGVLFGPSDVQVNYGLKVLTDVFVVDPTSFVSIKTGTRTVKLTTDAANLVSDSPVSMPSIVLSGTGTVLSTNQQVSVGVLTGASGTFTGTLGVSGALTAGPNSTVGGVGLSAGLATAAIQPGGFVSGAGIHTGDANGAIMRFRNTSSGALGNPYVQVQNANIEVTGGPMNVRSGMTVSDTTISYYSGGTLRGYYAVGFYGDPGVANAPEGSILIQ
jgi:hypothetical protein